MNNIDIFGGKVSEDIDKIKSMKTRIFYFIVLIAVYIKGKGETTITSLQ